MSEELNLLTPQQVLEVMIQNDNFSRWLGLKVEQMDFGYCKLSYTVREDMLNGFSSIHGGVLFSASDSAFAFSCNSHGTITVALDVSITFTKPAAVGDVLMVESKELFLGGRTALYDIRTVNQRGELVCVFKGTAYRTGKKIEQAG